MAKLGTAVENSPERPDSLIERLSRIIPWLVLLVGLTITYELWHVSQQNAEKKAQEHFDSRVRETIAKITQRIMVYEQVLRGAQGLFKASSSVGRGEFRDYVTTLKLADNYPGIQGIGFSQIISPEEKTSHINSIRKQGFAGYTIKPEGERELYSSVIYLEPFVERNLRAFGYDMYSESVRREAMERARDTREAALSGKVLLLQEAKQDIQAGFLIYLPVYRSDLPNVTLSQRRENIIGWVYSPFRTTDLMRGIFGDQTLGLNIQLYDGSTLTKRSLMYDSSSLFRNNVITTPHYSTQQKIENAGHHWTAVISSRPSFETQIEDKHPFMFAVSGTLICLLLTLIFWTLLNSRQRALLFAQKVNQELVASEVALRESEKALQATLDGTAVAIAWANADGKIEYANHEFQKLFGYTLEDVPTVQAWYEHAYPNIEYREKVVSKWEADIVAARKKNTSIPPIELKVTCKDGSIRHVILTSAWIGTNILASFSDISKLKQNEENLKLWANIFEYAEWGIIICPADCDHVELANPAFAQSHGYTKEEIIRMSVPELFAPEQRTELSNYLRKAQEKGHYTFESVHMRKDGSTFPVLIDITAVKDTKGELLYRIVNVQDISEYKQIENALRENRTILQAILDNLPHLVWMKDKEGRFIVINKAFFSSTGKKHPEEVLGKSDADLWPAPLADKYCRDDKIVIAEGRQLTREEQALDENKIIWTETFKSPVYDDNGELLGITGFAMDITKRKQEEIKIRHQAHHDALTGLPNRTLFYDRLEQALSHAKREKEQLAVLFIDLNQFKPINDTFGHEVGDLLLKGVASRIQSCVRESDTVARLGGDEFCIMLYSVELKEAERNITLVANKILEAIQRPFELSGITLNIAASIGVAVYPKDGIDEQTLIKNADIAMYAAKKEGYGNISFYTERESSKIIESDNV